jgi:hypothetical protein
MMQVQNNSQVQRRQSSQSWIQQKVIDGHQNQTLIALVEWEEALLECSSLVMAHTADVLSRACIQSSLAVLFLSLTTGSSKPNNATDLAVAVAELALVDLIHQPVLVSLRLMVKSTLLLHRREVMVVVEEL